MSTVVMALTVLAVGSSLGFLLFAGYHRQRYESAKAIITRELKVDRELLASGVKALASHRAALKELLQFGKLRLVLAVALIQQDQKVVLVKLRTNVFRECWGFPAGYVEADDLDASKAKADYEIQQYLPGANVQYLTCVTEPQSPVVVEYGGPVPVEVRVHQYALTESPGFDQDRVRLVQPEEIEHLDSVNPLVYDILGYHLRRLFSDDFEKKMDEIKHRVPSSIYSVGQLLERSDQTATDVADS